MTPFGTAHAFVDKRFAVGIIISKTIDRWLRISATGISLRGSTCLGERLDRRVPCHNLKAGKCWPDQRLVFPNLKHFFCAVTVADARPTVSPRRPQTFLDWSEKLPYGKVAGPYGTHATLINGVGDCFCSQLARRNSYMIKFKVHTQAYFKIEFAVNISLHACAKACIY